MRYAKVLPILLLATISATVLLVSCTDTDQRPLSQVLWPSPEPKRPKRPGEVEFEAIHELASQVRKVSPRLSTWGVELAATRLQQCSLAKYYARPDLVRGLARGEAGERIRLHFARNERDSTLLCEVLKQIDAERVVLWSGSIQTHSVPDGMDAFSIMLPDTEVDTSGDNVSRSEEVRIGPIRLHSDCVRLEATVHGAGIPTRQCAPWDSWP